ncbi:MAG: TolC family protein [Planctomycetota bacterium]|nr:TolC family protein [Planctomycetota bacterium]
MASPNDMNGGKTLARATLVLVAALAVLAVAAVPCPLAGEDITSDSEDRKQTTVNLAIRDAVAQAIEENLGVNAKRIEWKIATTDIDAANAQYDPVLYGEGHYGESRTAGAAMPLLGGLLGGEPTNEKKWRGRLGMQGKFPLGTTMDIFYQSERLETDTELLLFTPFNPTYKTELSLSVTQPLLKKGGLEYGTADEYIAQNNLTRAELAIVLAAETLISDVENAYWDLVASLKERDVRSKSIDLAKKFCDDVRDKLRNGHATEVDLRSAETDVAVQCESLCIVEQQIQDNQNRLRHLIAPFKYPLAETVIYVPTDNPAIMANRADIDSCVQAALKCRPEVLMKDIELKNAEIQLGKSRNELLPTFDLKLTGSAKSTSDAYTRSASEVLGVDYPQWEAGFYFEVPIGNAAAWSAHRRNRYTQELIKLERANLEQQIAQEVKQAANAFDTAFVRVDTASKSLDLAVKRYLAEKERFEQQHSTAYQVLQMLRDIVQAELSLEKSKVESNKAYSRLEKSRGTLLSDRGLQVK